MLKPRFSIITPTYNRADGRLQRCVASVLAQTCEDWEHIIVDDGSTDSTTDVVGVSARHRFIDDPRVRYVYVEHGGRIRARNAGMKRANGRWHLWLDDDDALTPYYLETVDYQARLEPEARWFICGAIVNGMHKDGAGRQGCPKWTKIREAWIPPVTSDGVHDHFDSGKFGTGQFIYHREVFEAIGILPNWGDHQDVADGVNGWLGYETPYSSDKRLCGNPYGDDWAYARRISQFYLAHPIQAALYVHYVR